MLARHAASRLRRVFDHPENCVRVRPEPFSELLERRLHAADHALHVQVVRGVVEDLERDDLP